MRKLATIAKFHLDGPQFVTARKFGVGILHWIRGLVVVALLFVTVFVGMVTFIILDDGATDTHHRVALFMTSPAHAWIVSVFTAMFS